MTLHDPIARQAFRQFQYPTLPLSVSSDYRTRVLRDALDRTIDATRLGGTKR